MEEREQSKDGSRRGPLWWSSGNVADMIRAVEGLQQWIAKNAPVRGNAIVAIAAVTSELLTRDPHDLTLQEQDEMVELFVSLVRKGVAEARSFRAAEGGALGAPGSRGYSPIRRWIRQHKLAHSTAKLNARKRVVEVMADFPVISWEEFAKLVRHDGADAHKHGRDCDRRGCEVAG